MLLAGLWHGAGWTFVFWGALHGGYLIFNHIARRFMPVLDGFKFVKVALTYFFVTIAWVPFRASDLEVTILYWKALAGLQGISLPTFLKPYMSEYLIHLGINNIQFKSVGFIHVLGMGYHIYGIIPLLAGLIIIFWFPNTSCIFRRYQPVISLHKHALEPATLKFLVWGPTVLWATVITLIFASAIILQGTPNEFLYFQF